MKDSTPPTPLAPQDDLIQQPLASPPPRWPAVLAWIVILAVVAFMMYSTIRPEVRGRKPSESGAAAGADLQLEIAAKTAVGAKQLAPGSIGPLLTAVEGTAKEPHQKIMVAIIAGELENQKSALDRLEALEKDPKLTAEQRQDITDLKTIYTQSPDAPHVSDALDTAARERLIAHYGFAGKLAVSFGKPDTDPTRQAVLWQAKRATIAVFAFEFVGIGLVIGGLILLVTGIVLLATGTLRLNYHPNRGEGNVYVCMFAVYLISYILLSLLIGKVYHSEASPMGGYFLLLLVLPIAFAFGRLCGKTWPQMRQALGWHGGRGWYVEVPLGIIGYIAGIPLVVVGFLITLFLIKSSHTTTGHPILNMPLETPWQIFQLYAIASFMAPVIEETMFRGALLHHLRRRWNWLISAIIVSFIFAAIHPQGWTTIPVLMSIAMVLAAIREWRDSILASMTAHAFSNGMVVTLLVLLRRGG